MLLSVTFTCIVQLHGSEAAWNHGASQFMQLSACFGPMAKMRQERSNCQSRCAHRHELLPHAAAMRYPWRQAWA